MNTDRYVTRGTTQRFSFTLPQELAIAALYITFAQGGSVVLDKSLADVEISGNIITLPLSQEDTLCFKRGVVEVQLRIRDTEGNAIASKPRRFMARDVLKEGVI